MSNELSANDSSDIEDAISSDILDAEELLIKQGLRALGLERFWYLQRFELKALMAGLSEEDRQVGQKLVTLAEEKPKGFWRRLRHRFTDNLRQQSVPVYSDAANALRLGYLEQQQDQLLRYKQYYARVAQLPADEIDAEIVRLGSRFAHVGRGPEWLAAFNELVETVVKQEPHEGDNEPAVRIAQSDFVLTLQRELALFWRYDELRRRVFDDENGELIVRFSYFEQSYAQDRAKAIASAKAGGVATAPLDVERFSQFINEIEQSLALVSSTATPMTRTEKLLSVDHQARIDAWADMKDNVLVSKVDPTVQFNELREVLIQAPEWRQELSIFRSSMHVQRLMDPRFESSGMEMDETEAFIARMVERVDEELPTDVIFRTLEQELLVAEEQEEALSLVRTQIAFEIRKRGADSAQNIVNYKRRFIESIWAAREKTAGVRPLFGRGVSRDAQSPDSKNNSFSSDPWRKR